MINSKHAMRSEKPSEERYRKALLESLREVIAAIRHLEVLPRIYDNEWQDTLAKELQDTDLSIGFKSPQHPLFLLCKDDPTHLRRLDRRLLALEVFNPEQLNAKVKEIRACRFTMQQLEHLFELGVLGVFAQMDKLLQAPFAVGSGTVDGLVRLDDRDILIEATLTTQPLQPSATGVGYAAVEPLTSQVAYKIGKKVTNERQLACAGTRPTILVIGLHLFAADQTTAKWAIDACFSQQEFTKCSAIVVSDSWKFLATRLHVNQRAANPLTAPELTRLRACLSEAAAPQASDET